jgi:hypothetical protein
MKNPKFHIKDITLEYIDQKYNFTSFEKTGGDKFQQQVFSKTKIVELPKDSKQTHFSYIDEAKIEHVCMITMKDIYNENIMQNSGKYHCFWCRNAFENKPVGCPIDYISDRIYKKYYSEITKNHYTLQETVTNSQLEQIEQIPVNNFTFEHSEQSFYLVDGLFCSFNCCLAFIEENEHNPIYSKSKMYLNNIYRELFPTVHHPITTAPSWRLLTDYGGELSIDDFRKNFYKVDFIEYNEFLKPPIDWRPVSKIFEKKLIL